MNELKIITDNANDRQMVSGRELHETLEIKTDYRKWMPRMIEYGFEEGADYTPVKNVHPQNLQEFTDHQMSISMAKEISMLQRNEAGKRVRKYLLAVEDAWNNPEMVVYRAMSFQKAQIEEQLNLIAELTPLAEYTKTALKSNGLLTINEIAQDVGTTGIKLNRFLNEKRIQYKQGNKWLLYAEYRNCGYMKSETTNKETSKGPRTFTHSKWTQKGKKFILDLLAEEEKANV